ncbi:LTA synthase family protein [Gallibacterium trehalosifermentans]|uniref:LTA synthase family protein n=1 Tax=Gallibacterium trehalosifermentans TaxID=516935 RepID=A0ABV6GY00_9PAST
MLRYLSFYPVLYFFVFNLLILSSSRLGLAFWQKERVDAVEGWFPLLIQGLRMDVVSLCWLFGLFAFLSALFLDKTRVGSAFRVILRIVLTAGSVFILFMELATPEFISTYDFRPNRLFVEYLVNPQEVFTMLAKGHLFTMIMSIVVTLLASWGYWKLAGYVVRDANAGRWIYRPVVAILVAGLVFIGARSTLAHRGINPAMVAFSSDALVNSLVLNSGYSVLFALQQMGDEENSSEIYGHMPFAEMEATLKKLHPRPESDYISGDIPLLSKNEASYHGKAKNLVIILEESLGAQFIGSLGGLPLAPNLDQLSKEGWWFTNLYATGTRSVRGIEAVVTGFTPTPARAVVKLPNSQTGFFTIADLLARKGYHTSFIYGGEKHFDNMASFFYGNGFQFIIDQNDYPKPMFKGTWGVSDEDLFIRADEEFRKLQQQGKPFFSLVFSSSNHDPFEFPDNKIELYEQPKATRNNAAKYADFAIGEFFKRARQSDYWQDTIFLVIADHDSRVAGASLVPIKHFHIPALILGAGIDAKQDNRLVSQIDMPPTLLSLIGIDAEYPMLGFDLTKYSPNRALMQFDKSMALMNEQQQVVILQPEKQPAGFKYDLMTKTLIPAEAPEEMKKQALSYALWGSYLYKHRLYHLPENK